MPAMIFNISIGLIMSYSMVLTKITKFPIQQSINTNLVTENHLLGFDRFFSVHDQEAVNKYCMLALNSV